MTTDQDIKNFGLDLQRFQVRLNSINPEGDVYQNKREIEELDNVYKRLKNKLEEIDNEIDSLERPLINKLNQHRSDLEILKNKLNEKRNECNNAYNKELLREGKLTGSEKNQTERNMILDQHKETDYQGQIIDSIASNIKGANKNLEGINTELKNQGEQMNRINDHVVDAEHEVKQTEKIFSRMERRQKCMKCTGVLAVILFGLFDLVFLIFYVIKFIEKLKNNDKK